MEFTKINRYLLGERINMAKKLIRLTESDLHKIVKESVKKVIKEEQEIDNQIQEIYQILQQNNLYPEDVFQDDSHPSCVITVRVNGDWKHDHLWCDYEVDNFLKSKGHEVISHSTDVTEEDGSDTYSAIHSYIIK